MFVVSAAAWLLLAPDAFGGGATGTQLKAGATKSDNGNYATILVTSAPNVACSGTASTDHRSMQLGDLVTGPGGAGQWSWRIAPGVPAGQWHIAMHCTVQGHIEAIRQSFPASGGGGRRTSSGQLFNAGTRHQTKITKKIPGGAGSAGAGSLYPKGQCTWYVATRRPDLPYFPGHSGDASRWITSAVKASIPTGRVPEVGAVAVFQPGVHGAGRYGHVAYVERVSGSTIGIREANYKKRKPGSKRTISWAGLDFIYLPTPPSPPPVTPPPPPAVPPPPPPGYQLAFQGSDGFLWTTTDGNSQIGMVSGTSPSITTIATGAYRAAVQARPGVLWLIGQGSLGLGMKSGTSPSITGLAGSGDEMSFVASDGTLWIAGADHGPLGPAVRAGTSPAITHLGAGYLIAYQASDGNLSLAGQVTANLHLAMAAGTSPSIAELAGGGYIVAYEASDGSLAVAGADTQTLAPSMRAGTSPATAPLVGGGYVVAYEASDGDLRVAGSYIHDFTVGVKAGTSPSVTGLADGSYEIAYQSREGVLSVVGSIARTFAPEMLPGTSPSITQAASAP